MENKCWCPRCNSFQKFNTNGKCVKCSLSIAFVYCYVGVTNKPDNILLDLYEKGDESYDKE